MRATVQLSVRVDPTAPERWKGAARRAGLSLVDWLTRRLDEAAGRETGSTPPARPAAAKPPPARPAKPTVRPAAGGPAGPVETAPVEPDANPFAPAAPAAPVEPVTPPKAEAAPPRADRARWGIGMFS